MPVKAKKKFVLDFIGHYDVLVDDRIGSRVGERCWAYADPYLKVSHIYLYEWVRVYTTARRRKLQDP